MSVVHCRLASIVCYRLAPVVIIDLHQLCISNCAHCTLLIVVCFAFVIGVRCMLSNGVICCAFVVGVRCRLLVFCVCSSCICSVLVISDRSPSLSLFFTGL